MIVFDDDTPGVGFVTSEKQSPSALDLLGAMTQAVSMERRLANAKPGSSKALKDLLGKCVSDFNSKVTIKKHRIDTHRKGLIYNLTLISIDKFWLLMLVAFCYDTWQIIFKWTLLYVYVHVWVENPLRMRAPQRLGAILHAHYDKFKHEQSGLLLRINCSMVQCSICTLFFCKKSLIVVWGSCRPTLRYPSARLLGARCHFTARIRKVSWQRTMARHPSEYGGVLPVVGDPYDPGAYRLVWVFLGCFNFFHVSTLLPFPMTSSERLEDFERKVQRDSTTKAKVWFLNLKPIFQPSLFIFNHRYQLNESYLCLPCPCRKLLS